ncbi:DnaJ-domain-containing protein [Coccomyxa subellipsoidea C-169]|uniref:DnaJ-domain-containing protein n=1 Tax=Coccomyxa subellipsoidea (strain C-169) TaxID=574566 RepID=I0YTD8_COCSC|nr:DnaJ-domain-containing protein [Coccomyxa subellipsoidea C-169]EIE21657.1 DnaJ-domain-containing protein [Coccomyxa subellipsoidea C-169]|eukprot:XP_005646201.1 DnaJ-domain-containing protein [Coccomyxa subellipsoidea C-169]
MEQQLERGRAAVRITRDILQQQPDLKQELRQLLWRIDQGEAVQIAGIPDPQLHLQLDALFVNINLAKTSKMDDEMEEEDDDLIGPAPPELVTELENAGSDDRSKEVIRILRVLDDAHVQADAYGIMGVEHDAKAAAVKKRYWRLSLLIHPDKCDHPRANDAFDAVNKAAKDLQDAGKRSAIDADREDARLRRLAEEMAAQQERERQWRVARGTATAEDLRGPIRSGPAERDTWMTELPEARRPNAQPSQTTFSQRGIQERGDTQGWTETPQQKLLRLSAGEAASTKALESAPAPSVAEGVVDAYNQAHRAKTLVEQHKDRLKEEKRKKKKQKLEEKSKAKAEPSEDWDPSSHPWRPFDREKDLNMGPKSLSKEEMLKKAGTLDSRFAGTPSGQRSFL